MELQTKIRVTRTVSIVTCALSMLLVQGCTTTKLPEPQDGQYTIEVTDFYMVERSVVSSGDVLTMFTNSPGWSLLGLGLSVSKSAEPLYRIVLKGKDVKTGDELRFEVSSDKKPEYVPQKGDVLQVYKNKKRMGWKKKDIATEDVGQLGNN